MKAVVANKDGKISIEEVASPQLQDGQIEIRTSCSLISPGTELHYVNEAAKNSTNQYLGYCASGYVEKVGNHVNGFSIGDRVIAMGWQYAIHAERICVPQRLCVVIPDNLPFDKAVFANLTATALHAIHRASLSKKERVLIIGAGLVGQLVAQCAQVYESEVYLADISEGRLQAAKDAGIHKVFNPLKKALADSALNATKGKGFNTIFLCNTGDNTSIIQDSIRLLANSPDGQKRGKIIGVGRFKASIHFNVSMGNVDIRYASRCGTGYRDDEYVHGRLDYPPPPGEASVDSNLKACLNLIHEGKICINSIHTHRIKFNDAVFAYELFQNPDHVIGVTLHYE